MSFVHRLLPEPDQHETTFLGEFFRRETVGGALATVLLVAPVTLLLCDRLALDPVPFLLAEVMASNIGGTATLIGDPPNIIIGSRADLGFNEFLVHLAPIVLVLLVVFVGLCWLLWGRRLRYDADRAEAVMRLEARETITDPRLLVRVGVVLVLVLVGFVTHAVTHLEPSLVALLGAGARSWSLGCLIRCTSRRSSGRRCCSSSVCS